ncbi:hypothetical protein Tco_0930779, partial [Tanacetum coccineum]
RLLVREVILEFYSMFRIREDVLDFDAFDTFQFQLGVHFRVIIEESLQALTVEVCGFTTTDIDKLVRLRICDRLGDVVTWVVMGPERQQVGAAAGAAHINLEAA